MFLLIHGVTSYYGDAFLFTFQYVSINTPAPLNHRLILPYYTIFCRPWYFFYLFIYFDITRFTGSTILLMFFTFVDLS